MTDDIAVNEVFVSAETLDSRRGGGCLPVSRELALDSTFPRTESPPSASSRREDCRFRFPREVAVDSVGFGFAAVLERALGSV